MIPLPTGWNLRVVTPTTAAGDSLAVAAHIASIYTEFGLEFDLQFEDDLIDLDVSYSTGCFWIIEGAGRTSLSGCTLRPRRVAAASPVRSFGWPARGGTSRAPSFGAMCASATPTSCTCLRAFCRDRRGCLTIPTAA